MVDLKTKKCNTDVIGELPVYTRFGFGSKASVCNDKLIAWQMKREWSADKLVPFVYREDTKEWEERGLLLDGLLIKGMSLVGTVTAPIEQTAIGHDEDDQQDDNICDLDSI